MSGFQEDPIPCNNTALPHMHPLSDRIRRKIRMLKMSPIEKWHSKKQMPWKLALQALKIVFVTIQLIIYGHRINKHFQQQTSTLAIMKETFLSDPDLSLDIMPYPPSFPAAFHNRDEFYDHVSKVVSVYTALNRGLFGVFDFGDEVAPNNPISSIAFCYESYEHGSMDPSRFFFNYSSNLRKECINISNPNWNQGDTVSPIILNRETTLSSLTPTGMAKLLLPRLFERQQDFNQL